jgi:hypothetical protein
MAVNQDVSFYMEKALQKATSPDVKRYFLIEWYIKMFPYIPFVTGTLASTMDVEIQHSPETAMETGLENIDQNIHFKAPYASNMYYGDGFNFTKDQHHSAQARWAQVAAELHGQELVENLKKYIRREISK